MEFDDPSESANSNATGTRTMTSYDVPIFDYQPLDETKQQIRLLRLQRKRTGEVLECDIATHDLENLPKYIALSYVWGCPQPTHPLLIQGKRLHIRQNLHRFLREFLGEGLFWIDQICIDQSNIRERNHQVNLMSRIYKQCASVITWIGDVDGSDVCSTAAREFNKWFRPEDLVPILCNSYFTRLWIVQENLLAPVVRILVEGGEWLRWSDIQGAVAHMSKDDMQQLQAAQSVAVPLLNAWLPKNLKRCYELDWVFRSFHTCGCENPRDKVFGLMGLAHPYGGVRKRLDVQVDYSKSVYDTFAEVAVEWHRYYKAYLLPESVSSRLKYEERRRKARPLEETKPSERDSLSHMRLMRQEAKDKERGERRTKELLKVLSGLGLSMGLDKVTVEYAIETARTHATHSNQEQQHLQQHSLSDSSTSQLTLAL